MVAIPLRRRLVARTIIQLQDNGLMSSVKSVQQEQTKIRKAMALQDHKHIYIDCFTAARPLPHAANSLKMLHI